MDGLEQRLSQQDSANRGILEQLMKIQQDFKVGLDPVLVSQDQDQEMIAKLLILYLYVKYYS